MRRGVGVTAVFLAGAGTSADSDSARDEPTLLRLEATDFAFPAPKTIPAGPTRVRLINQGRAWHAALLTRLPEGTSVDTYLAGERAGESFPASATDVGGPGQTAVGDSSEVMVRLAPGRYAVVCWSDNHVKAGMIALLVVTGSSADSLMEPARADVDVSLQDFRFVHSAPFRGGHQVLRIRNDGRTPHNMQLYRLEPGRTLRRAAERRGPARYP